MTLLRCMTLAIAGIAVPVLVPPVAAEPVKLVSESYEHPVARRRDPALRPQQAAAGDDDLHA